MTGTEIALAVGEYNKLIRLFDVAVEPAGEFENVGLAIFVAPQERDKRQHGWTTRTG